MKISLKKFIIVFLVSAFVFMGVTNLILVPVNGDWFAGMNSPIPWKRSLAHIIYPIKIVLVGPLAPIFNDPDPPPPLRLIVCAIYWTVLASAFYFLIRGIKMLTRGTGSNSAT